MDSLPFITLAGAAVSGALAGAAACYWPLSRVITGLRQRLERSEQARNGAVERSAQAREQIAQLNRAITELRRTHSAQPRQPAARQQLDKALAKGDEETLLPRHEPLKAFADTQLMSKL